MNASISFLDSTVDSGPGNSYDITMYEDLDEELKHRENKSVPAWANDSKQSKLGQYIINNVIKICILFFA